MYEFFSIYESYINRENKCMMPKCPVEQEISVGFKKCVRKWHEVFNGDSHF